MLVDYALIQAARYFKVAPWELEGHPEKDFWIARAATVKGADTLAQEILRDIESKRAK